MISLDVIICSVLFCSALLSGFYNWSERCEIGLALEVLLHICLNVTIFSLCVFELGSGRYQVVQDMFVA